MERDRIWSATQSAQNPKKAVTQTAEAPAEHTIAPQITKLEAERDAALAEVARLRRALEVMRKTAEDGRGEAEGEIERLRQALTITRKAAEDERDVAQRERRTLVDNLNAQQELLNRKRQRKLFGGLFAGSKRMALA